MKKYVVYFHRNPETGNVFYVGMGNSKRPYQFLLRNPFWIKYTRKYGLPVVEVVKRDLEHEDAFNLEKYYISQFGRRGIDKLGALVNRTIGGEGVKGAPVSEATKKKLSVIWKGKKRSEEDCRRISEGQRGRKLSEAWRQSLSESKKGPKNPFFGKKFSAEHKARLCGRSGEKHPRFGKKNSEESKRKRREAIGDKYKRGDHPYAKKAICEITGMHFNCLKDAWEASGCKITYESFARCLRGEKRNKTGFKLIINAKS